MLENNSNQHLAVSWAEPFDRVTYMVHLFDLSGKLLLQKNNNSNQNSIDIDLPDLPGGVYILKIGTVIKKLIIR